MHVHVHVHLNMCSTVFTCEITFNTLSEHGERDMTGTVRIHFLNQCVYLLQQDLAVKQGSIFIADEAIIEYTACTCVQMYL